MEFIFAYIAGLLTLINPCVLPVLPIVLMSALNANRLGPVALAAGMSLSFVVFGVLVSAFGHSIGLTQDTLSQVGAVLMMLFGAILLLPSLARRFEVITAGLAKNADQGMNQLNHQRIKGQFIGGILLGAVWSPCIGPTLGGAIALASQGDHLGHVTLIMSFFALGVSTFILALGLGAREAMGRRAKALNAIAERSKPIMGAVFLSVGLMLFFHLHHIIEAALLTVMPVWLQDLSVTF
ncbi:MAG: cytochrome c biogenesis CcdA family protein [Cellvibrionaceae bacterium]|nr:cytochrome c biogenesis CcdA family protein [Cellvibrionaceae bacterium]